MRGNVTVLPDPPETHTAAGIHIPDIAIVNLSPDQARKNGGKTTAVERTGRTPSGRGTVVTIGDGYFDKKTGKRIPILVRPGDRVAYRAYAGWDVTVNDVYHLLLDEADILAVLEDAAPVPEAVAV